MFARSTESSVFTVLVEGVQENAALLAFSCFLFSFIYRILVIVQSSQMSCVALVRMVFEGMVVLRYGYFHTSVSYACPS